jgi:hypothetical protein
VLKTDKILLFITFYPTSKLGNATIPEQAKNPEPKPETVHLSKVNKDLVSEIIIKAFSVPGWNVLLKEIVRLLLLVQNNVLKIRKTSIIYIL